MSSNMRKADTLDVKIQAAKLSKKRALDSELRRQWRPINLDNESFYLPKAESLNRHPTFNLRRCTLSGIFFEICDACSYFKDGFGYGLCCINV